MFARAAIGRRKLSRRKTDAQQAPADGLRGAGDFSTNAGSCRNTGREGRRSSRGIRGHAGLWLAVLLAVIAVHADVGHLLGAESAADVDEQFLAGLRQRELFSLAESYCQRSLNESELSPQRRARLTIEWSRTLVDHALHDGPEQQAPLWKQAHQVLAQYEKLHAKSSWALLVRVQAALALLAQGEWLTQQASLTGMPDAPSEATSEATRDFFRRAIRGLEAVDAEIAQRMRVPTRNDSTKETELDEEQLRGLRRRGQYHLARAFRLQASSYDSGSPDRVASLTRAVEILGPLAQSTISDDVVWNSRIDRIRCLVELKDYEGASRRLDLLEQQEPPPKARLAARAQRINLAMQQGDLTRAAELAEQASVLEGETLAELDMACFELFLRQWQEAARKKKDPNVIADLRASLDELLVEIQARHGLLYLRRAESMLASRVADLPGEKDLDVLQRIAETFYRGGQMEAALRTYDQAREQAAAEAIQDRAWEFGYAAAAIQQRLGHHRDAANRYRTLALSRLKSPEAPEAHLLGIFNLSQAARQSSDASLDEYGAALEEHLAHWPEGESAGEAHWWLGRLQQAQRKWPEAVKSLQAVDPQHARYADAVTTLATVYRQWIAAEMAEGKPVARLAADAAQWLAAQAGETAASDEVKTKAMRAVAAITAADFWIQFASDGYDDAQRVLEQVTSDASVLPAWRSRANSLLIVAYAGQGDGQQARETLGAISEADHAELFAVITRLEGLASTAQGPLSRELAELVLVAVERLKPARDQLTAQHARQLDMATAGALTILDRSSQAQTLLQRLAEQYPQDGEVRELLATTLGAREDAASRETALNQWRQLERGSKAASPRWFRARYQQARLLVALNRRDEAQKLLGVTRLVHPELGGPRMKAQFDALWQKVEP
jgi:hypothetical protein